MWGLIGEQAQLDWRSDHAPRVDPRDSEVKNSFRSAGLIRPKCDAMATLKSFYNYQIGQSDPFHFPRWRRWDASSPELLQFRSWIHFEIASGFFERSKASYSCPDPVLHCRQFAIHPT
jgi:hypothetical protein